MLKLLIVLISMLNLAAAYGAPHRSNVHLVEGVKFPNSAEEGVEPVRVSVNAVEAGAQLPGFSELLPFALRSPNQEEAGSCLYMSLTGIAEWWMAKLNPRALRTPDGPIDLSERYLMNLAGIDEDSNGIQNWKTDSIDLFNKSGSTLRNIDYRFTKGWYVHDAKGDLQRATRTTPGAEYDASYNWIDETASVSGAPRVRLPKFKRTVLFADPASNQWNTGVMPDTIVDQIKTALRENQAPVHVIYNHFGYWHATVILGFDDNADTENCKFVNRFIPYMQEKEQEYRRQAANEKNPAERQKILARAEKTANAWQGAKRVLDRKGCDRAGVFYVRDSIYGDPQGPQYDYDLSQTGEEAAYGKTIVTHEYDWVRAMANHVVQIGVEGK